MPYKDSEIKRQYQHAYSISRRTQKVILLMNENRELKSRLNQEKQGAVENAISNELKSDILPPCLSPEILKRDEEQMNQFKRLANL